VVSESFSRRVQKRGKTLIRIRSRDEARN